MAITDINISEQLETGAPSIKYTGKEGPRPSMQSQQEMQIAQQIWEAMGDEERGQFSNFQEFFRSGIWKQILQQAQQDEAQGQQGIASLGPRNTEQEPRLGAEYGGRIGFRQGAVPDLEVMKRVKFYVVVMGMSPKVAIEQVTLDAQREASQSEGSSPRPEIILDYQAPLRPKPRKRHPPIEREMREGSDIRDWWDKIKEEGYPDRADFEDAGFPGGRGEIWGGKIPYKPSELHAYDQGERTGIETLRGISKPYRTILRGRR